MSEDINKDRIGYCQRFNKDTEMCAECIHKFACYTNEFYCFEGRYRKGGDIVDVAMCYAENIEEAEKHFESIKKRKKATKNCVVEVISQDKMPDDEDKEELDKSPIV